MKRYGLLILLALPLLAEAADRRMVTLKGRVIDEATKEGLPLVEVKIAGQQDLPTVNTDGKGNYVIAKVPAGSFTLEFRKLGFTYFPTSVKQTVSQGEAMIEDVFLIEQNAPSDDYYTRLANRDVQRVQRQISGGGQPAQEYAKAWSRLEEMNISPSGRAAYARSLTTLAPDVTTLKLPKLQDYAAAKPDAIRRFQAETERAVTSDTHLTTRAELKRQGLTDAVIVDVAASTLKKSNAPAEAKRDFVTKFGRNFGSASENELMNVAPHSRGSVRPDSGSRTSGPSTGTTTSGDDKRTPQPKVHRPGLERSR